MIRVEPRILRQQLVFGFHDRARLGRSEFAVHRELIGQGVAQGVIVIHDQDRSFGRHVYSPCNPDTGWSMP